MTRRSGVPLERVARRRYDPGEVLAGADGTIPLDRPDVARRLAAAINASRAGGADGGPPVESSALHALGLLHRVFHLLVERYERQVRPGALGDAVDALADELGADEVEHLLAAFDDRFPRAVGPERAPDAAEELLLTWLANVNPAAEPLRELVDDRPLAAATRYEAAIGALQAFLAAQPPFTTGDGTRGETLVEMLRAPILASPTSLAGQLRYVRERWGAEVGELLDAILIGLDLIAEEERALHLRFGGGAARGGWGGTVETPSLGGLEEEPERFSRDSDWMPRLVLIAKSTYVWLDQLSRRFGREIRTLDAIPDEELDALAATGVTGLWLIGLWQRSVASERIKRMRGNPDAVASAYSLDDYRIADDLGGEAAFENLRDRAGARGIRLASDMVPNHMGIDSRWVIEHPERFVSLAQPPYPAYTFDGPDLSPGGRVGIFLEDHYWDNTDAAVVFKRLDRDTGEARYVYHGNDGTSFPWNDTAQLDYLNPDVREAVIRTILDVARRSPVIRFDAAMVLAKKHIERLWYPEPGKGGAIPSRAEHGSMPKAAFEAAMPQEFWREVVDRVAAEVPDTLLLAEAFWLLEGYFVRTLGMHRVYNSAFMHMLRDEDNAGYRRLIKETLEFDRAILQRYVNFMSNPDEETAVEQFGKDDKYFGVATLLATLPGLPMIGHGQIEGFAEKYGMEFRRATRDEQPDPWLVERHRREIVPLLQRRGWFAGGDDFVLYDFVTDSGEVDEHVFAYSNGRGPTRSLVVYHNRYGSTAGRIRDSSPFAVKGEGGLRALSRRTLADALDLRDGGADRVVAFRDARDGLEYAHRAGQLDRGLSLRLDAYACHVFWEFRALDDPTGEWATLADRLAGEGVASLDEALRGQRLEPVHEAFRAALAAPADARAVANVVRAVAATARTTDASATSVAAAIQARRRAIERVAAAIAGTAGEAETSTGVLAAVAPAPLSRRPEAPPLPGATTPAADLDRFDPAEPAVRATLDAWALVEPLGGLVPDADPIATSAAWWDELRLGSASQAAFEARGLGEPAARAAAERAGWLIGLARPSTVAGASDADRAAAVVDTWLGNPVTRVALRVNTWQDAEWFDREVWRELAAWALLLEQVHHAAEPPWAVSGHGEPSPPESPSAARLPGPSVAASRAILAGLVASAQRAGYRVEALLGLLAPVSRPRPEARPRL